MASSSSFTVKIYEKETKSRFCFGDSFKLFILLDKGSKVQAESFSFKLGNNLRDNKPKETKCWLVLEVSEGFSVKG